MRGTRKRWSCSAGALRNISPAGHESFIASDRKALVIGTACDVGGMSSSATSATPATAFRMTSSWGASSANSSSVNSMRARSATRLTSCGVRATFVTPSCVYAAALAAGVSVTTPPPSEDDHLADVAILTTTECWPTAPPAHPAAAP